MAQRLDRTSTNKAAVQRRRAAASEYSGLTKADLERLFSDPAEVKKALVHVVAELGALLADSSGLSGSERRRVKSGEGNK